MLQTHLLTTLKLSFHLKLRPKWRVQLQDEGAPSASPTGGDHLNLTMCDFQHSKKTLGFCGVTRSTAPPTKLDPTTEKRNVPSPDRKLETSCRDFCCFLTPTFEPFLSLLLPSFCHTSPPTLSLDGRPNLNPHYLGSFHHLQSIPPPAPPVSLSSTTANRKKLRADP